MVDVSTLRANLGWSQARMADYLGMSQAGVHYLENTGRLKRPVRMMLEQLAAEHGLSLTSNCAGGEASSAGVASPAGSDLAPPAPSGGAEPCGGAPCA